MTYDKLCEEYLSEYFSIKHHISKLRKNLTLCKTQRDKRDINRRVLMYYEVSRELKATYRHLESVQGGCPLI